MMTCLLYLIFQMTPQVLIQSSLTTWWILSRLPSEDSGGRLNPEEAPGGRGSRDRGQQQTREASRRGTETGGRGGGEGAAGGAKEAEGRRGERGRGCRCRAVAACWRRCTSTWRTWGWVTKPKRNWSSGTAAAPAQRRRQTMTKSSRTSRITKSWTRTRPPAPAADQSPLTMTYLSWTTTLCITRSRSIRPESVAASEDVAQRAKAGLHKRRWELQSSRRSVTAPTATPQSEDILSSSEAPTSIWKVTRAGIQEVCAD